jgi:hypothetical protein
MHQYRPMRNYFYLIALLSALNASAKRLPPPEVEPISKDGIIYSFQVQPLPVGSHVFLTATKGVSGKVWMRELYQTKMDPKLETDVQSIFPRSLSFKGKDNIQLVDERGTVYIVSRTDGALVKPKKVKVYDYSK